jgi:hypothetical protein
MESQYWSAASVTPLFLTTDIDVAPDASTMSTRTFARCRSRMGNFTAARKMAVAE